MTKPLIILAAVAVALVQPTNAQLRPTQSTYVPQHDSESSERLGRAVSRYAERSRRRTETNEEKLTDLLSWVYELKPQATGDPQLYRALEGYQARLEGLQEGSLSRIGDDLRGIDLAIRRAISDAQVRAGGGPPAGSEAAADRDQAEAVRALLAAHDVILQSPRGLKETFDDGRNGWQTEPEEGETIRLRSGYYTVGVTGRDGLHSFTTEVPHLAGATRYAIEAPIRHTKNGGGTAPVIGLLWGMEDANNYTAILLNPGDQSVSVYRVAGGEVTTLAQGRSSVVRGGGINNVIRVTAYGGNTHVSLNREILWAGPSPAPAGGVGYLVGPQQELSAHAITIGVD